MNIKCMFGHNWVDEPSVHVGGIIRKCKKCSKNYIFY